METSAPQSAPSSNDASAPDQTRAKNIVSDDCVSLPQRLLRPTPMRRHGSKRNWRDTINTSSDPPMFSSDDLPSSSMENYQQPRSKAQHRRVWYEDEQQATKRACLTHALDARRDRGPFRRNYDSGVFLGSDESLETSTSSDDDARALEHLVQEVEREEARKVTVDMDKPQELLSQPVAELKKVALRHTEDLGYFSGPVFPYWQTQPKELEHFHSAQKIAAERVLYCDENGKEEVDLSDLGLEQIRTGTVKPLNYSIGLSQPTRSNCMYTSLQPKLRLYLSNNRLTELPGVLYQLAHLRTLSLRGNKIREVLPAIGNLSQLEELNLAGNRLRYLPWELYEMLRGGRPTEKSRKAPSAKIYPNPFISPVHKKESVGITDSNQTILSTPPAFLSVTGDNLPMYPPAPTSLSSHNLSTRDEACPPASQRNRVPSLLEIVLRTCQRAPNASQIPFLLPDSAPSHLSPLLQRAFRLKEASSYNIDSIVQPCTICGREFIVPRTEWVEWRSLSSDGHSQTTLSQRSDDSAENASQQIAATDNLVPFVRRGCSWACFVHTSAGEESQTQHCVTQGKGAAQSHHSVATREMNDLTYKYCGWSSSGQT